MQSELMGIGVRRSVEEMAFGKLEFPDLTFHTIEPNTIHAITVPILTGAKESRKKKLRDIEPEFKRPISSNTTGYVDKLLTEQIPLQECINCPTKIKLSQRFHSNFNYLRENIKSPQRLHFIYVTNGRSIFGSPSNSPYNPDFEKTKVFSSFLEHEVQQTYSKRFIGDIQPALGNFQGEDVRYPFFRFPNQDVEALSIRQLYRFLTNKALPKFTGKAYYTSNIWAMRTADTVNLSVRDESKFENYWYRKYGYFNMWTGLMSANYTEGIIEEMNLEIAKRYKFAIYRGKPNEPLIRLA